MTAPTFRRYVAIGDSTTEGLEDPYEDGSGYRGWADRLAEALGVSNPELEYANLAIRGRKVPQMRAEQLEPALALRPDLASVLGGVNDILRRHVDLGQIGGDMEAMVAALRAQGATVIMMTYPDPTAVISVAASRIRARVERFNEALRKIASRNSAVLVDLDRDGIAHARLWCEDRLHANGLGHERMAAAAGTALGIAWPSEEWRAELPELPPRRLPARVVGDAAWMGRHLTPWMVRRLRGRSSGDGRLPKRPQLSPVSERVG